MKDYAVKLKLLSPTGTPWQSDTMMGHLAWQVAFGKSDLEIDEFLLLFKEGEPPFVISDGFPEGLLPKPLFLDVGVEEKIASVEDYARFKKWVKAGFLNTEDFQMVCRGKKPRGEPVPDPWVLTETLHASLDRKRGTTGGAGQLFATDSRVLPEDIASVVFYLRVADDWRGRVVDLFNEVGKIGYGRDKSVGLGQFEVAEVEECSLFEPFEGATGFVSLSSYVPAQNDPTEGFWNIRVKRGKLGEHAGGRGKPFKKPLIQFEPGAVFRLEGAPRPWYGRAVENISDGMKEAVQLCFTFAAPCVFRQL